jgi:hypothetical protein
MPHEYIWGTEANLHALLTPVVERGGQLHASVTSSPMEEPLHRSQDEQHIHFALGDEENKLSLADN